MAIKLIKPVVYGQITQNFGENLCDYTKWGYPGHNGIDYGCTIGTPVMAAADGTVFRVAFEAGGYGKYVVIDHGGGYFTYYCHLSVISTLHRMKVTSGTVIAQSGDTGNSTGPHLHFGLKVPGGKPSYKGYVDPAPFFLSDIQAPMPPEDFQNVLPLKPVTTMHVTVDGLNVRSGPGIQFDAVGKLNMGDTVEVSSVTGTAWVHIGNNRWVAWIYDEDIYLK